MSSALIRKAATDAGFDLELGGRGKWTELGISGTTGTVWVDDTSAAPCLAVVTERLSGELANETPVSQSLSPANAILTVQVQSPEALYHALRRLRVVLQEGPPRLEERWRTRLAMVTATEAEAVVRQRIGQDLFRDALMDYWGGRCAVTSLDAPELLRASHAKPWKDASDAERLDLHNGLLLAVHLDALFDRGLLTFRSDGAGRVSNRLSAVTLQALGVVGKGIRLSRVAPAHVPYLLYHEEHVFRG